MDGTCDITQYIVESPRDISQYMVSRVAVKAGYVVGDGVEPIIRRFTEDYEVLICYQGLLAKVAQVFPGLTQDSFSLQWIDEEGDPIEITSDDEARTALDSRSEGATLNLVIRGNEMQHPGVVCDGCEKGVYGLRYKCMVCTDYDLCSQCERRGAHPHHAMVRITTPRTKENVFEEYYYGVPLSGMGGLFVREMPAMRPCMRRCYKPCPQKSGKTFKGPGGSDKDPQGRCGSEKDPQGQCGSEKTFPYEKFNNIAATMMREWCETLKAQRCSGGAHGGAEDREGESPASGQEDKTDDPSCDLFSALLSEVLEGVSEHLKSNGGKRHHESKTSEGSQPKQARSSEGGDGEESEAHSAFDFKELEEMLAPMAQRFINGMAAASEDTKEGRDETEAGTSTDSDLPKPEEGRPKPGASPLLQRLHHVFGNRFQEQRGGEDEAPAESDKPGTSRGDGRRDGSHPWQRMAELLQASRADTDEEIKTRVARSMEQLTTMGFSDENGWLTRLVETKHGNLSQVLDALFPAHR